LFFVFAKATFPQEDELRVSNSYISERRIYKDAPTGFQMAISEEKSFYPDGKLCYRAIEINGEFAFFQSYTKEGKVLGEIIAGKGRLIVPDDNGCVSPQGTTSPFSKANCYYRCGEPVTKEEFMRREKLQDKRIENAFKQKNTGVKRGRSSRSLSSQNK
jgi:hypothetical protein